jgi:cobyrinic acid a,c-diamide synthase
MVLGYERFDERVRLAGIIVNRVGSDRHGAGVSAAIEAATGLPVLGWIKREPSLHIPERHLGLVPEVADKSGRRLAETAGEIVEAGIDLDRLLRLAGETTYHAGLQHFALGEPAAPTVVVAVARDEAFHFTYQENLDLLAGAGAKLAFFSPLHDTALPPETSGILLSGGFPEVHAAPLAQNRLMHEALRQAHDNRLPIYAECGGLMYLTEAIVDFDGQRLPMVGLLPGESHMTRRLTLGYRFARASRDSWLFLAGESVRGHEFHYSAWQRTDEISPAYALMPATGGGQPSSDGACVDNLFASYLHLHFWAKSELPQRFVAACRAATPVHQEA